MMELDFNPKADRALDLLTPDFLARIYDLARDRFDIQGTYKIHVFCRNEFGCELHEISIEAAKWVIGHLSKLPSFPRKPLPPRLPDRVEGEILPPPPPRDENVWGTKL